jgi:hypothetical protein
MFIDLITSTVTSISGKQRHRRTGPGSNSSTETEQTEFHGTFELPAPASMRQGAMRHRIVDALISCG